MRALRGCDRPEAQGRLLARLWRAQLHRPRKLRVRRGRSGPGADLPGRRLLPADAKLAGSKRLRRKRTRQLDVGAVPVSLATTALHIGIQSTEGLRPVRCKKPRDEAQGSLCRHWSECRGQGNLAPDASTCDSDQPNCCAAGYRGWLCELCDEGMARVGGNCVVCEGAQVSRLVLSAIFALAFVMYLMHSAVKTIENATAMFMIVVFYAQVTALLFRGRYSSVAYFASVIEIVISHDPGCRCLC